MKLKNKKTGEIIELESLIQFDTEDRTYEVPSIETLNEEWEDAPEGPKDYWRIGCDGVISHGIDQFDTPFDNACNSLGNYFDTKEEAELAVRKLKAWKRLKDKGFRFELWDYDLWDYDGSDAQGIIRTGRILFRVKDYEEVDELLDLLFSGGEE